MVVLCFSVGFKEGSSEMSNWLEQPEEGGVDSDDQMKGKEVEEEEQGKLLASIEAESSHLETELKGLMRLYVLMLFQRERKGELVRVEKKQKELNAHLGELRRARDLWLEADKDEVTVVDSNEDRSGGVDLPDVSSGGEREGVRGRGRERMGRKGMRSDRGVQMKRSRDAEPYL